MAEATTAKGAAESDRPWIAGFLALGALHLWALWAHHGLEMPYAHKAVFLFHFDFERNLPTAFSVLLLARAARLCAVLGNLRSVGPRIWRGLAGLFAFLAVDEGFSLHERLIDPVGTLLPDVPVLTFAWIVPYGLGALALIVGLRGWWLRLPRELRLGVALSAAIYIAGALGVEALGGWWIDGRLESRGLGYDLLVTVEESLEMIGLLLFARVLGRRRDALGPS